MDQLSHSMWQKRKEGLNRSTNNGDMDKKAKWMNEWVSLWHLYNYWVAELLKIVADYYFNMKSLIINKSLDPSNKDKSHFYKTILLIGLQFWLVVLFFR